ncbi:MAG: NAD(P)/FAD-dependent oxidoreductase [Promethearchaeota archaeon]
MPTGEIFDIVVIGAGPAGYSAAIYSVRYKLKTLVVAEDVGGLLLYSDIVENYPGYARIHGKVLMEKFFEHADSLGIQIKNDVVERLSKSGRNYMVELSDGSMIETRCICLAMGTTHRKLNVPGEDENIGMGVSYCATCDGAFFKNRTCCVIGGSDSAAKEALVLSRIARKVHVIYRKSRLRSEPLLSERVYNTGNIEVIHNSTVAEICTNEHGLVDRVILDDGSVVKTDGVFIEIGFDPNSALATDLGVETNGKNEIIVDRECRTNVPGIFAAGDITDSSLKQAITAAGDGARASWAAYQYLMSSH